MSSEQRIIEILGAHHLRCPRCDYSLFALSDCRCPECGIRITMPLLKKAADRRGENWLALGVAISLFASAGMILAGATYATESLFSGIIVAIFGAAGCLLAITAAWAWDHPFSDLGRSLFGLKSILLGWSPTIFAIFVVIPLAAIAG